jgi:hypothetical protein
MFPAAKPEWMKSTIHAVCPPITTLNLSHHVMHLMLLFLWV